MLQQYSSKRIALLVVAGATTTLFLVCSDCGPKKRQWRPAHNQYVPKQVAASQWPKVLYCLRNIAARKPSFFLQRMTTLILILNHWILHNSFFFRLRNQPRHWSAQYRSCRRNTVVDILIVFLKRWIIDQLMVFFWKNLFLPFFLTFHLTGALLVQLLD